MKKPVSTASVNAQISVRKNHVKRLPSAPGLPSSDTDRPAEKPTKTAKSRHTGLGPLPGEESLLPRDLGDEFEQICRSPKAVKTSRSGF